MSLVKNDACACSFCNSGGGGVEDQNMAKSLTTQPFNAPSQAALVSSDARCSTPCRFDSGLVDQDLRECCNACLFTSVGRGKRPNRGHEGGRPLDLRDRQGASTSEIHRVAGTAAQRPLEQALFAASRRCRTSDNVETKAALNEA